MSRRGVYLFWRAAAGRGQLRAGEWRPLRLRHQWGAMLCCPRCETVSEVDPVSVDAEGLVPQPVLCPSLRCGWLQSAQLQGWEEAVS